MLAGTVTDADVGLGAGIPVVNGENRMAGGVIVHLHAAVPVFQRALLIAEIEALPAGARYVRAVERCVLVGPEFDIAALKALTLLDTFYIREDV